MSTLAIETFGELLALFLAAVGSVAATAAGTIVEEAAVRNLLTGHVVLGAWEGVMGGLLLAAGVWVIGYQKLYPELVRLRGST